MDVDDAMDKLRAVERGELPSGSVIVPITGPNSLLTPGVDQVDALRDRSLAAREQWHGLALKTLAIVLRNQYPTAAWLELEEGDQSEHDVVFCALKDEQEINLDVDELDDDSDYLVSSLDDWRLNELIGIVRTRVNGRSPIWVIDLEQAATMDAPDVSIAGTPVTEYAYRTMYHWDGEDQVHWNSTTLAAAQNNLDKLRAGTYRDNCWIERRPLGQWERIDTDKEGQ